MSTTTSAVPWAKSGPVTLGEHEGPTGVAAFPTMRTDPAAATRPYRTVLLATDLTHASDEATAHATELAAQLGARLLVLYVIDPRSGPLRALGGGLGRRPVEEREDRSAALGALVATARMAGAAATFLIWDGEPAATILSAAEAEVADVIVVGTRSRGAIGRLLGSVSDQVLRDALVPVLIVRPGRT